VNLRPSAPPVPLLFALLVLVAASARFGAQALAELSGAGQATLWGLGAMWTSLAGCGSWLLIMLVVAYVNLARPLPLPARAAQPEPVQMAQEIVTGFRPNMVFVPWGHGLTKTLHISGEQLDELQARIGAAQLGLPVNGMQTFTSAGMKNFRREAVAQELAIWEGRNKNIAHLTEEGAAALLRSSPALAVSARVRGNVRDTHAYNG
jgi:hypothetical protein